MTHIPRKTSAFTVRLAPEVEDALQLSALTERRGLPNLVEIAILEYYTKHKDNPQRAGNGLRAK